MGKALVCDRCGAVINFSEKGHDSMFQLELHPYVSTRSISGSTGNCFDLCRACVDEILDFTKIKEDKE